MTLGAIFALVIFLCWVAGMTTLMVWGVRDWRRTGSWYVACLAIGAALNILSVGLFGVIPAVIAYLDRPYHSYPTPATVLSGYFQLAGDWTLLLSVAFLIIGGLAFYVAYPRLPPLRRKSNGESNGDEG